MLIKIAVPELLEFPNAFFGTYWVKTVFLGSVSSSYPVNALASTYVRLVQTAITEYRHAGTDLRRFWGTHDAIALGSMQQAIGHYETCLTSMHRAICCFVRLRRHIDVPIALRNNLNLEKPGFIANNVSDQLREIRNAIHHVEDRLLNGSILPGTHFSLQPDGPVTPIEDDQPNQTLKTIDRLVIGDIEISLRSICDWLVEMGHYAEKISDYDPYNPRSVIAPSS